MSYGISSHHAKSKTEEKQENGQIREVLWERVARMVVSICQRNGLEKRLK